MRLTAHSVAEEEHVYPALTESEPDEADDVHHGVHEHREAEDKLAELERADDDTFDKALAEFVGAVRHHVEEEESSILPALRKAVTAERLAELGTVFEDRRQRELAVAVGTRTRPPV